MGAIFSAAPRCDTKGKYSQFPIATNPERSFGRARNTGRKGSDRGNDGVDNVDGTEAFPKPLKEPMLLLKDEDLRGGEEPPRRAAESDEVNSAATREAAETARGAFT